MTKPNETPLLTADNIERICSIVYFNRWLILACFLAGAAVALGIFRLTPATYPSEAKLLVRYVSEAVPIASSSGNSVVAPGINVINSEIAILESRDQIEKVVNEIGLARFGVESTNATQRLSTIRHVLLNLSVSALNNSNIIYIRFEGPDPALAQDFLTSLIRHYLEKHVDIHRDAGAYEFLSKQTDQLRSRLTETEAELRTLKTDSGIISLEESAKTALAKVEDLERQQREAETSLAASEAKVGVMRPFQTMTSTNMRTVASSPESRYPSSAYYLLVDRLKQLQNREAELLYSYMASSGPVQSIRAQITQAQADVEAEIRKNKELPTDMTNVVIVAGSPEWGLTVRAEESESAALRAKSEVLKKQLDQAKAESKHLASLDERIVQLQRNKELQEQNYRYFSQRLEQARVDNALDTAKISNVVIVQPPSYPISKHRNKVAQRMSLAVVLGLAIGVGLACLRESATTASVKTPAQIESQLGLPTLLSIPFMNFAKRLPLFTHPLLERVSLARSTSDPPASGVNTDLLDTLHPYCEALRDRLLSLAKKTDTSPYLLGIAGCHRGAGASTLASGLAAALARNNDGHILILDADLEHTTAHRLLPQGPASLTSFTGDGQGNTFVLQPNLYMLSCCEATSTPAPIPLNSGITGLAQNLSASKYRYVIFDLPPINDISLALRIAPTLDGLILVLEAGAGSMAKAAYARDLLKHTGPPLLGIILNKTKPFMPAFLGASN